MNIVLREDASYKPPRIQINLDYASSPHREKYIRSIKEKYCISFTELVYRAVKHYENSVLSLKERNDYDE